MPARAGQRRTWKGRQWRASLKAVLRRWTVWPRKRMGGMPARRRLFHRMRLECKWPIDGLLDLRQLGADALLAPEEGQGGRVVAEEQDALAGLQGVEGAANLGQVFGAQAFPFGPFGGQHVGLEDRQGDEGRDEAQQDIAADFELPEGVQSHFLPGAAPTGQAHAAAAAEHGDLAQLVVAEVGAQVGAESLAELVRGTRARSGRRHRRSGRRRRSCRSNRRWR